MRILPELELPKVPQKRILKSLGVEVGRLL
jgi:hypothetical protein